MLQNEVSPHLPAILLMSILLSIPSVGGSIMLLAGTWYLVGLVHNPQDSWVLFCIVFVWLLNPFIRAGVEF